MVSPTHHSSLTRQLVVPVVGLLLAAVLANVAFAAWLAARRSTEAVRKQQMQVATALAASRVSLSMPVLDALHRLTGSHFIVWNEASSVRGLSTLTPDSLNLIDNARIASGIAVAAITVGTQRYQIGVVRSQGVRPETVLVLTPRDALVGTTLDAVWPVLAVAAATLAVLIPLGMRTTGTLARRIGSIERHVGRIAEGQFGERLVEARAQHTWPHPEPTDEIGRLVIGVNRMSTMLGELRTSLVAGERQRLLGQLAAGFAHELRNAITGARLAIDLHRRRCPMTASAQEAHTRLLDSPPDESLAVAIRQLGIVEEEVRGLLALGKKTEAKPSVLSVDTLLTEVRDLTSPRCEHAGVQLHCEHPMGLEVFGRHDTLRAAMVNLALNGIDAAGHGGTVWLSGTALLSGAGSQEHVALAVVDTGPGPPEAIREALCDPFVTGKMEGIGLGLTVAKTVAEEHGGTLEWDRVNDRTRFTILLPRSGEGASHWECA